MSDVATPDRNARFIASDKTGDAPLLRTVFDLDEGHGLVTSATLILSALGVVEARINGAPVSPDVLTPGWTSFEWRLRYSETDVTRLIGTGRVAVGLALGNGWFHSPLTWQELTPYGFEVAGFAELRIRFEDGHEQIVASDESWRSHPSSTTKNSLYNGQSIDARRPVTGWDTAGFDDANWHGVHAVDFDLNHLEPYVGPAVRRQGELAPQRIWTSPAGRILVDFGQNLVGWLRVRVHGASGETITVRHAEVLERDELGTRPLRLAEATDRFTLSGEIDEFEPTFTFHGFRYAEITGWPGGIENILEGQLTAVVVSSDLRRIGTFSSSNAMLNKLHENVVWGMRGNFLDVPTDCPQRDERLGWTGDIAAFAPTAVYLFDSEDFLRDWLGDLRLEQAHHSGIVPFVIPDVLKFDPDATPFTPFDSTAIWSDAAAWVPWAMWQAYGNADVLRESFPSIVAHVRHVKGLLSENGVWDQGFQFGDWLDPDAPPEAADLAKADRGVVATASIYRSVRIAADAASILGLDQEEEEFAVLAEQLTHSFHDVYISDERILSDCTTVYSLAIVFGLLTDDERVWAGDRLAELVRQSGHRISTGFAGTPFITDALSSTGHLDEAYGLLLQTESPSWLYPVTMEATTIWERWDSMLPDGTINPGEMTSFNHYALGAVADWMHRVVGGLAPLDPGYRRILVAPQPGGDLDWAESTLDTPHGSAGVRWVRDGTSLTVSVTVPNGSSAVVRLPGSAEREVGAGVHELRGTLD